MQKPVAIGLSMGPWKPRSILVSEELADEGRPVTDFAHQLEYGEIDQRRPRGTVRLSTGPPRGYKTRFWRQKAEERERERERIALGFQCNHFADKISKIICAHLFHHPGTVILDSAGADRELVRDLLV